MRFLILLFPALLCAQIDTSKLVDLTWPYDEKTIYWPTGKAFQWEKESWGPSPGGYWYASGRYAASEHGGTHIDAPIHFGKGKQTLDEIPLAQLVARAIVVDISAACARNPDYSLSAADLAAWEKAHGRIPDSSIVLVRTGWGKFWPDKKRYLGSDTPGDTAHLHFPGIAPDAAKFLAEQRKIAGVGIDTASIDHGPSKDFMTHRILNGAGIYGLENVAYLEKVPVTGATLIALPMKIKGGSGGPVRIVALLP
jgi:kynurenine formamidase